MQKQCNVCEEIKDINYFYKIRNLYDCSCKKCRTILNSHGDKLKKINKAKKYLREKRYRLKNPLRTKANDIIRKMVYRGKIKRGRCVVCKRANATAHHSDYNKPYKIIWLCVLCHMAVYNNNIDVSLYEVDLDTTLNEMLERKRG